jgi:lipopolysaccharide transport system ATP-binding protein
MTAVKVDHLWKTFQIPHERRTTLFENLIGMMKPKQYESLTVLRDVSFEVNEGECVGIIGDNGSGKSTLLKIVANILRPSKGTVRVNGKMTPFLELGVGFQPDLTVLENIDVYAAVMGLSKKEIRDRTDDIIKFAGLHKFEDTKLKNLSSGMQVRLAFSTAIQTDPNVLLVDEVLAVGDIEFQHKCFEVFNHYRKEGVTILFVSHDLSAIRRLCDKALLLGNGKRMDFDETSRVLDRYVYESREGDLDRQEEKQINPNDNETGKSKKITKKLEITSVKFIDKRGKERINFISGDPITIRIFYSAQERILHPIFGIIVYQQDVYCFGTNTEFMGFDIKILTGNGYLDFIVDRLPLLEGKFDITVAASSADYKFNYDWHDRRYSFTVHKANKDIGLFSIDGRWRLDSIA